MKKTDRPKYNMWQCICFMVKTGWEKRKSVLGLAIVIIVLQVAERLVRLFITPSILAMVEKQTDLMELQWYILEFSAALFAITVLKGYAEQNTMGQQVQVRIAVVADINKKACRTSYPNLKEPAVLKLQRAANDAGSGNESALEHIWLTMTSLLVNVIGFLIYLALLSNLNFLLICVMTVTTVIGFFASKRINEWEYYHKEEKSKYNKQIHYIQDKAKSIELAKDIRIFGLGEWLSEIYDKAWRLYMAFVVRREKVYIWTNIIDVVLALARNSIAYVYLIVMTVEQNLTAADFLLYFSAISGFTSLIKGILTEFSKLHKECLDISSVQEYLNLTEPFHFDEGLPVPVADQYELCLSNVSFKYPGSDKYIIKNMNLTIKAGEKLAIVGLNGAGKTTLVRLLCGFYDPLEGCVLLNGMDIREFNRREYYKKFSAVFQEFSVLDVSIAEMVAQTADNIELNKVLDCLEKAGLSEQIKKFPNGLQTHVGRDVYLDGVLLSGGQMQRLMLARALYKGGSILVLDEPTAALDPIAENDIYMKYNEMTAGKTSIFISHRLASTRFCDRIVFLAEGAVLEEGTHEELLKRDGEYAKLFKVQSRYYQEGGEAYVEGK